MIYVNYKTYCFKEWLLYFQNEICIVFDNTADVYYFAK